MGSNERWDDESPEHIARTEAFYIDINEVTNADYQRARCHEALEETASAISIYQRIVQREGGDSPFGAAAHERIEALQRGFGDHRAGGNRSPN